MRKITIAAMLLCLLISLSVKKLSAQTKIKIACVGNSITEGSGLSKTYPQVLQALLGENYKVHNYGVGGRTLLKKGDYPYWNEAMYKEVLAWNPDIVVIKLGTNDTKPQNWEFKKDFVKDYVSLIRSFKKLPSKPQVFISYPIPVYEDKWGISEAIVKNEVLPAIDKIARKAKVQKIDLYTPFIDKAQLTYDGVHPNDEGAKLLASAVYQALIASKVIKAK